MRLERARVAAALLGVTPEDLRRAADAPGRTARAAGAARALARIMRESTMGGVVVITGPSGGGKSTLLARLSDELRRGNWRVIGPALPAFRAGSALDQVARSAERAMAWLARAGLADAACFLTPVDRLSDGQKARLRLAMMLERAERGGAVRRAILLDEFGSALDATTARGVAGLLRRWADDSAARGRAVWIIAATVHDACARALAPDWRIGVSLEGGVAISGPLPRRAADSARVRIEPGGRAEYEALARWHYRAGAPRGVVKVLAARDARSSELAGVLTVSMPVINGGWRSLVWPGGYDTGEKRRDIERLNREVRCISRVIVDPRWRGLGVAKRLVRAYLREPLTVRTEAVAAMGRVSPFFRAAGMREHVLPPCARDARLGDAAAFALGDREARSAKLSGWRGAFLQRESARWAMSSRAGVPMRRLDPNTLTRTVLARVPSEEGEAWRWVYSDG